MGDDGKWVAAAALFLAAAACAAVAISGTDWGKGGLPPCGSRPSVHMVEGAYGLCGAPWRRW